MGRAASARYTLGMTLGKTLARLAAGVLILISLAACGLATPPAVVADVNGLARIDSGAGAMDFIISSGLTGERLPGARASLAEVGGIRLLYAEDPSGAHLPLAAPIGGQSTVRRITLPPRSVQGYNIATAAGEINVDALAKIGTLTESDLHSHLDAAGDRAVLIYFYNPSRPLALTGASLDAWATPYPNVIVLKAGGEPPDAKLALVIVGMERTAYASWANLNVDRYLAARVGQPPDLDTQDDLTFAWAFPVFQVDPPQPTIDAGRKDQTALTITWRSSSPDPPPPWKLFIKSDNPAVVPTPGEISISPGDPPQTISLAINRTGLKPGEYSATLYVQPFNETTGLIEQRVTRALTFEVITLPPTPTPGPPVKSLEVKPEQPKTGDTLIVTASGFAPGERVLVEFSGPAHRLSDSLPQADATGQIVYRIDLTGFPSDDYQLTLTGQQSAVTGSAPVTVAARPPDAIVASAELNVRFEPFKDSPVLEVLVKGDAVQVIAVNGDASWLQVVTPSGKRGWVQTKLVTLNIDLKSVPWNPNYPAPGG